MNRNWRIDILNCLPGIHLLSSAVTRSTPSNNCCANSSMLLDSGRRPDRPVSTISSSAPRVPFITALGISTAQLFSVSATRPPLQLTWSTRTKRPEGNPEPPPNLSYSVFIVHPGPTLAPTESRMLNARISSETHYRNTRCVIRARSVRGE